MQAPNIYYDRIKMIVDYLGHQGFTPYERVQQAGVDYVYTTLRQPLALRLSEV